MLRGAVLEASLRGHRSHLDARMQAEAGRVTATGLVTPETTSGVSCSPAPQLVEASTQAGHVRDGDESCGDRRSGGAGTPRRVTLAHGAARCGPVQRPPNVRATKPTLRTILPASRAPRMAAHHPSATFGRTRPVSPRSALSPPELPHAVTHARSHGTYPGYGLLVRVGHPMHRARVPSPASVVCAYPLRSCGPVYPTDRGAGQK
jgi:hypothetical protein